MTIKIHKDLYDGRENITIKSALDLTDSKAQAEAMSAIEIAMDAPTKWNEGPFGELYTVRKAMVFRVALDGSVKVSIAE